ncbi:hypothetical protein L249_5019 [Ophiocordyceps polyrhachis-furcata BCC 54312]|uniref:FYVE-type domain-containing protein n=1 Tax=Ophiocordyceps polyrhachis-furcata BCC 54312 TaxID=1330021 RepID=A0A367L3H7_9HYPO|nr:hypothetical protein L249_5019 [Ophiocordyceps polyrhachis-furcata BCC 54312]
MAIPVIICHSHLSFAPLDIVDGFTLVISPRRPPLMSARRLGGGRILGNGKGLAPPTPPTGSSRSGSPFAPSESSASLGSISLSPPASGSLPDHLGHDIGSSISVEAQSRDRAGLVCPICSEEMMTLLQLNRHIDDNHQELPEQEQDEVKTWFDKQVLKAKRFQPLTLINQKLRGLDVFESNESNPLPPQATASGKQPFGGPIDPEELITRNHWQRSTAHDVCTDPTCGRGLGPINGNINCRKCGRLFCEAHTMYQMKLSRSANHEPVRGYWARVCETCYKSREGYNDHVGVSVNHTDAFSEMRRKRVERQKLETSRLEKRLTKLTRLLAELPENSSVANGSLLSPVSSLMGHKDPRKLLEQSVVPWEDDDAVAKCPFCQQEFGSWTFRRHHCRICGRVVCADAQTGCSSEVSLNIHSEDGAELTLVEKAATTLSEKTKANELQADLRMCRDCNNTIFSHRDFAASIQHKPADQKAYETLRQFERGIRLLLPVFHRSLVSLQSSGLGNGEVERARTSPAQMQEASKIRKRLIDSFGKYGAAAKRLRALKAENETQRRLQEAVYAHSSSFLHANMLPLKSLPGMLRHQRSSSISSNNSNNNRHSNNNNPLTSSSLRHTELVATDDPSPASSPSQAGLAGRRPPSDDATVLESEEKRLKEKMAVLQEQRLLVDDMIRIASSGSRRFDEVTALARNRDELDHEIGRLERSVVDLERRLEGVYAHGSAG